MFYFVMGVLGLGLVALVVTHDSGSVLGLTSDRFAGLIYFGVLAAVIGASALRRSRRGGFALQSAAIWITIVLALVGGYQYRYELQDVAHRVTAGLVPSSPLSLDGDGETVMLQRSGNGHFEVRAHVNGAAIVTIVDTGATNTVLTAEDARRAGIDPDTLSYSVPVMTANGQASAAFARADEIRVGDIVRRDMAVLVAEEGRLGRSLLGMNFIGSLSGFDMRGDRLILRD